MGEERKALLCVERCGKKAQEEGPEWETGEWAEDDTAECLTAS